MCGNRLNTNTCIENPHLSILYKCKPQYLLSHKSILPKVFLLLKLTLHVLKDPIEPGAKSLSCLCTIKHVKQIGSLSVQIQFLIMMFLFSCFLASKGIVWLCWWRYWHDDGCKPLSLNQFVLLQLGQCHAIHGSLNVLGALILLPLW